MSFGLGANLKIGTSQKLTPQMQQAIRLLQLSSIELEQEVQAQLDSNPMLERDDSGDDALDNTEDASRLDNNLDALNNISSSNNTDHQNSTQDPIHSSETTYKENTSNIDKSANSNMDSLEKLENPTMDDSAVDTDWSNLYNHESTGLSRVDTSEMADYQGNTTSSIQDHIRWQLNFKHLSETDMLIADYLVDAMDDSGFINLSLDELCQSFATIACFYQWEDAIEHAEIEAVLHIIQSCDPIGAGARDLSECLTIQLNKLPDTTPHIDHAKALLAHSQYLLSNNINKLLAETQLSIENIEPALTLIRTLNPAPGQAYANTQPTYGIEPESYDIPDVLVSMVHETNTHINQQSSQQSADLYDYAANDSKSDASPADMHALDQNNEQTDKQTNNELTDAVTWRVELNPDTLPKLKINQEYASLVKRGDNSPDNTYLRNNLSDAKLFIRSIQERNQNLLKVATCIVQRQEQFLLHGATAMQPLILKEVADEVELHESTVSRITTSKSMLTPQGLFSLKYFFSSSVSGCDGDVSSTAICAMIEALITTENPKKPLSDSAIAQHLHEQGINIARRTVAKYREQLNIGSSTQRKQRY